VAVEWVDCDRQTVSRRYDRIARLIPFLDRMFFLPRDLRQQAVKHLGLSPGDSVLEIGCGTGNSLAYLHDAVGSEGAIYGVDISPGMLRQAAARSRAHGWDNVELVESDAADYIAPVPLDGVLFSLSYNTMPHHRAVLRQAWLRLRPGGRLVIMDAKLPSGPAAKWLLPFSIWLMRHTMLGNPLIQPWKELGAIAKHVEMNERLFTSYYICRAIKPSTRGAVDGSRDPAHIEPDEKFAQRMAAE